MSRFHRLLKFHLKRGINTHLQSLEIDPLLSEEVGVSTMPVSVDSANTEKVRAYGSELNALAVVSGLGAVRQDIAGQRVVEVSSEYLIIPSMAQFQPRTIYVDDSFLVEQLQSARLIESLHQLWGQNTVLALTLREARVAFPNKDKAKLQKARNYLIAERARAGPGSQLIVRQIEALLTLIDKELGN
jgi:hypothetical protein